MGRGEEGRGRKTERDGRGVERRNEKGRKTNGKDIWEDIMGRGLRSERGKGREGQRRTMREKNKGGENQRVSVKREEGLVGRCLNMYSLSVFKR